MRKLIIPAILLAVLVPAVSFAQTTCSQNYAGTTLCNALPSFGGVPVTDIPSLMGAVFAWLASIIGTVALVMVMYSGAQMVISRGDSAAVAKAKSSLTYSIAGVIVILFAYVIVSAVQYFIGFNNAVQPGQAPGNFFVNPLRETNMLVFLDSSMRDLLSFVGTVTMIYIIYAGFRYMTAGSNEDQVKKSKAGLSWAIIGLICIILSYLIVVTVFNTVLKRI